MTPGQSRDVVEAKSLAELEEASHLWAVYARLQSSKQLRTRANKPYAVIELTDADTTIEGKAWEDSPAFRSLQKLEPPIPVKVLGEFQRYQDRPQLMVRQIRPVSESEDDYDPAMLEDPNLARVEDIAYETLVIDIETVPAVERRALPTTVAESLAKYADRKEMEPGAVMGLSPFFGKVVSLAVGNGDAEPDESAVTVLAVPPAGREQDDFPDWIRPMSEPELLGAFWALAGRAKVVVTYNGRGFDVPFLVTRSLIHGIPARVDLLSNRFALRPHLDLFDVLGQRGRGPSNLDVVCWALGIESPKEHMDGSMVAPTYERGEIEKIAEYNAHDVRATTDVFRRVRDSILRYRGDW